MGCKATQLDSTNPINQCCESSSGTYKCNNCGSCAGENTAGNPSAPGQLLIRYSDLDQTCCSYKDAGRGAFYFRNGTAVTDATTGLPLTCDGRDTASCCKIGNGNTPDDFACFDSIDVDDTVPDGVPNDDVSLLII